MTYTEKITDAITGEEIIRILTDDEAAVVNAELVKIEKVIAERESEQAAKNAARQAVLDKLGLSADEVAALLG
jgi:hypothetical protein